MSRFFAFGCSFTRYYWPTWADIISTNFDSYENWGEIGFGNHFIFNSLIECDQRNKLSKDDTVIVCWSNSAREDRYTDSWTSSVLTNPQNEHLWRTRQLTEKGCLIRDLAFIKAAQSLLTSIGCKFYFISMVPIAYIDQQNDRTQELADVLSLYKDSIDSISPSIWEVVFDKDYSSRRPRYHPEERDLVRNDPHPRPLEHLEYIDKILTDFTISDDVRVVCNTLTEDLINYNKVSNPWYKAPINRF